MKVKYTRRFKQGDKGPDVEAVGHALSRLGYGIKLHWFLLQPQTSRRKWGLRKRKALKKFKRIHPRLVTDDVYSIKTHKELTKFFTKYEKELMESYKPPVHSIHWEKMLKAMKELNGKTAGYIYSAGHGSSLKDLTPKSYYDCSSAVSKILYEGGVFPSEYAWSSGQFANYGLPGKGKYFTVYYHSGHVFLRLHKSIWWRFDTSPYSYTDNRKGPRLRLLPRPTFGFGARHWPGM